MLMKKLNFFLGNIFYSYCIVIDILNNMSTMAFQTAMSRLLQEELKKKPYGIMNGETIKCFLNKDKSNFQKKKGNFTNKILNQRPISPIIVNKKHEKCEVF